MKRYSFTNADLRSAAAVVCNAMLEQLPEPSQCRHTFSDEFEQKMRELIDHKPHHNAWRKFAQRAAAVILAALIGIGAWLTVDQDARAGVARWVREVYENSVFYRFTGDSPTNEPFDHELSWVPDGYELADQIGNGTTHVYVYKKGTDVFTVTFHRMSDSSFVKLIDVGDECENVKIHNLTGHYYPAADDTSTNDLVWIDDIAGMYYCISAYLDYEDILHIADGIKLVKLPK